MFHYTNEEIKESLKPTSPNGSHFCETCRWRSKGGLPYSPPYCSEPVKVLTTPKIPDRLCRKINPNHTCYLFELRRTIRK